MSPNWVGIREVLRIDLIAGRRAEARATCRESDMRCQRGAITVSTQDEGAVLGERPAQRRRLTTPSRAYWWIGLQRVGATESRRFLFWRELGELRR